MKILKFGGSSLATPETILRVVAIVQDALPHHPVVVVSAFGGATDDLITAADLAAQRDKSYSVVLDRLERRHQQAVRRLADPSEQESLLRLLTQHFGDLGDLLHGVFLLREASLRTRDAVLAYGERLSAEVVAAALRSAGLEASALDARNLVVTDAGFGRAQVDLEVSYLKIRDAFAGCLEIAVVTGFTGATVEGQTTTLGRGGSDYTAALLGAATDAETIELWTDVDGVMTSDPRQVEEAFPQDALSYAELMELSHFGAKVVYPPTIHPARSHGIPLLIKNTFNPAAAGTRVEESSPPNPHPIRGLAAIHRVALLRLEGDGMVGVPGIAMRLFGALAKNGVSVILISQSSSEHSICFAVAPEDTESTRRAVGEEFALEVRVGMIDELVIEEGQSVIAAVGEEMRHRPGISGRLFGVLGQQGINVKAIAQGSSELNISLVVDSKEEQKALLALHSTFFTPHKKVLEVAVVGVGRVGAALIQQIHAAADELSAREGLELRVVALANSRRMVLDADGIDLADWRHKLSLGPQRDGAAWLDFLLTPGGSPRVIIDCTASDEIVVDHIHLLTEGLAVVAANKRPFAGPQSLFDDLLAAESEGRSALFFEATVGAGLPVLSTLADLRRTGDQIHRIDGILSGTINAVLDRLSADLPFSVAVQQAREEGLTEPHPWDDLSGSDVARKLCILARLLGQRLELVEIVVEPLLTGGSWAQMDLETFWQRLPEVDTMFETRRRSAQEEGKRLRYVASVSSTEARVSLVDVDAEHPAHGLSGPDNLVAFTTARYDATPLVIRGPGAGSAVTAAGVFADLLRAGERLTARQQI
jgi:aspartokinase/homoserine dehydrogenase 1